MNLGDRHLKRRLRVVSDINSISAKKSQQQVHTTVETTFTKRRLRDLIEDLKAELKNITWTTRDELLLYTKLVVASTFVFGIGIYLIDLAIQGSLNALNWITRLIAG